MYWHNKSCASSPNYDQNYTMEIPPAKEAQHLQYIYNSNASSHILILQRLPNFCIARRPTKHIPCQNLTQLCKEEGDGIPLLDRLHA
jgi:hypothetical protein